MSFENDTIPDQVCVHCGYSLQGLPAGSKCPECGQSSQARKKSNIRQATMSFQASPKYVKWVRTGFLLCLVSILGGLGMPILAMAAGSKSMLFPIALVLFVGASACWTGGVWMVTRPRKGIGEVTHDNTLDNPVIIKAARVLSFAWPTWILLTAWGLVTGTLGAAAGGAGGTALMFSVLIALVGLGSWISLIPACIYFGEMAHWAADERLANRLRGTAWVMVVFGSIMIISKLLTKTSLPIASPAKIVNVWMTAFIFIATVVLFYSIFRMTILMDWVLSHQRKSADKHARLAARVANQMNSQGTISSKTACEYCGYNLEGLAFNGNCPECGERYGQGTIFPIRDPAKDIPKHDGSTIGIEDSTHSTIKHTRPLGLPLEDLPDREIEGGDSIPLADEPND